MRTDRFGILALGILLGLVTLSVPTAVIAQQWPTRPVKVIVPLGPGSGTDVIARLFSDRLSGRWNKPVVVENRPGGDGMIGINAFLAAADDHVLLFTATSVFTGHSYLHDKLPYDPDDLVPAAQVNDTPVVIAVPAALNVTSVKELVDMARARPNALNAAPSRAFFRP
jgi:tripartite-type tricarboxylate transporter receptor subunit TctC